jgi:hypothetical protein
VVFLDEVGLAEDSPAMPLKVLHSLLEKPEVAFVGLSNWDLDPAKMNRAVYLLRPDARPEDLSETAIAIVTGASEDPNVDLVQVPDEASRPMLTPLRRQ